MRIKKNTLRDIIRNVILEKRFADFDPLKGQYVEFAPADFVDQDEEEPDLSDEVFDLVQTAYAPVGGNIKVQSSNDLPGKYTWLRAMDIDEDPEPDIFRGGKYVGGKLKLGITGHDGSRAAKDEYIRSTVDQLNSGTAFAEMSKGAAHAMITRHGVPAVTDPAIAASLLGAGRPFKWLGKHPDSKLADKYGPDYEGWYTRSISGADDTGHEEVKIILGG